MTKQRRDRLLSRVMAILMAVALLAGPLAGPVLAGCCDPAGQHVSAASTAPVLHHAMKAKAAASERCHGDAAAKLCQGLSCGLCFAGLSVSPLAVPSENGLSPRAVAPALLLVGLAPPPPIDPPRTAA